MNLVPAKFAPEHFRWEFANGVATITFNRPERKNPLTFDSYAELRETFRALVKALRSSAWVLTGAGGNFCSGGDVHRDHRAADQDGLDGLLKFTRMTGELVRATMRSCPQPIVAAVEGVCAARRSDLALASDFGCGAERRDRLPVTRSACRAPTMGACAILPRISGHGRLRNCCSPAAT